MKKVALITGITGQDAAYVAELVGAKVPTNVPKLGSYSRPASASSGRKR
jgi:GDP-D-mannose dehydratase